MNSSDQNPKLPAWPFIAFDVAALGAAGFIAWASAKPLSETAMLGIVVCIGIGAIAGLVPLVLFYERQKNEILDQRQRDLEALSRTVSSSAEQISIAANGLHEIAEMALKNIRMAEHLPQKLQEKVAELQAQLAATNDAEKEELERELLALRTSESERLESVSQRIAKSTAEWTKLEAASSQHLAAANDALAKLALGIASASVVSQVQAAAPDAGEAPPAEPGATATPPPKRVRKPRREESPGSGSAPEPENAAAAPPATSSVPPSPSTPAPIAAPPAAAPTPVEEPPPVPAEEIPEVTPIAPATAEPFSGHIATIQNGHAAASVEPVAAAATAIATAPKMPRKRSSRPAEADDHPGLGLDLDDSSSASMAEGVLSSDGATRLLVTAYIGIGNRLFIRGSGPGLSWEKGVPLQFVSIGKWRWETSDASAPVQFKLYKNDDLECAALGQQLLEPGRQQEVTAAF